MVQKHAIAKNFFYNVIFKIFQLITPVITVPYIARILGSEGVGTYAFTNAVLSYFSIFALLGVITYGNRSIAYVRESIEERSRVFWEIFSIRLLVSAVVLLAYIAFILSFGGEYTNLYIIQVLFLLGAIFDISWFFAALEDFKRIITRDIIVRIVSIIMIFTLVKTRNDLDIYVFILSAASCVSSLVMWFSLKDRIIFQKPDINRTFSHIRPLLILFIPAVAGQIYTLFDRILLNLYIGESEVGYYEMAIKIITISSTATMTLGVIMLPRMSNLFAKQDFVTIKDYMGKCFRFLNFVSIPMVLGMIAIADDFVPWFLGDDFKKVPLLLSVLSVLIFLNGWVNTLVNQILLPMGMEKIIAVNTCIGAVLSLGLNFLLIPHFQGIGAAASTIITYFILGNIIIYKVRHILPFREIFREAWKYVFAGIIMFTAIYYLGILMPASIPTTFAQILSGVIAYAAMTSALKCEMNGLILKKIRQIMG